MSTMRFYLSKGLEVGRESNIWSLGVCQTFLLEIIFHVQFYDT